MAADDREAKESPRDVGADEIIAFTITTTPWGTTQPTAGSASDDIFLVEGSTFTSKSSTLLTGTLSLSGSSITTRQITGLSPGKTYRHEVKFTISGNTFETYKTLKVTH